MKETRSMSSRVRDKLIAFNKVSEELRIIFFYRYASWAVTSLFYLLGEPRGPSAFKLGVVISLFLAAQVTMGLKLKYYHKPIVIKTLIFTETIGITLLLIPTGGLDSTFMWYALNPVLVAARLLPAFYCWLDLVFYLAVATLISFIFQRPRGELK